MYIVQGRPVRASYDA